MTTPPRASLVLLASVVLSAAPLGAQRALPPPLTGWDAFTRLFDTSAARDSIVGGGVLVLRDGRVIAQHAYGLADRAAGQPVTERTIFHYGSITKTLTAIAIMQLRDRGRLSLDDRVVSYIPELRMVHDPYGSIDSVTIRMLLSHSAGLQNPTWPYKQGKPWEPFEPTSWNQLVAMMPYQELLFKPDSRYSYSNPGFIYLGRIIEQLSGDPWETYVQKNILSPLALTHSYFGMTPYYLASDRSHNYTLMRDSAGRELVRDNGSDFDPGITIPNGGWNAPLGDLAAYLAFLTATTHGDAAKQRLYDIVLKRPSLEEMWRPQHPTADSTGDRSESVGLSFFVVRRGPTTLIGHTGSQAGFISFMYLNPASGAAVVAAFNTENGLPPGAGPSGSRPSAFGIIREAAMRLIQ
ncbi:MAG: serine hydrolase domain-containing protein [Gemmatimonadaceae bacterium]